MSLHEGQENSPRARFPLGQVVVTRGVLGSLTIATICVLLDRHASGDWGELDRHDRRANERALKDGTRLLFSYRPPDKGCESKVWIITEADRSLTTVLLPEEY